MLSFFQLNMELALSIIEQAVNKAIEMPDWVMNTSEQFVVTNAIEGENAFNAWIRSMARLVLERNRERVVVVCVETQKSGMNGG